jgi:hypothetical protein
MQLDQLKRRDFITLLGSAAVAGHVEFSGQEKTLVRNVACRCSNEGRPTSY